MSLRRTEFDVAIVGGGPAGITAAATLGKKGYSTIVLDAAVFPGAENWSGTVYFAENLVQEEAFGREIIEKAPYERKLVKRGSAFYDGISMFGGGYRNEDTFRNCYTVLRPVFDRYLSEVVREWGVTVLPETTVQSLIYEDGRVIGCHTERGPVYADCTFLAEGDASHLTSQEGYEKVEGGRPEFLQGIKEVIHLPPEVIEERFGVDPGKGAAKEVLIRNGNIGGQTARLNMGAFLYTNRDSISIGLVLPLENLKKQSLGDHNDLMEWFKGLPEIARLIEGGEMKSFGTKIIRGGGYHEIPQMVDDGLAIGGAATGIGLDFPYPNFTGPATRMGLAFGRAYHALSRENGDVSEAELEQTYVRSVKDSHYYRNVRYLADFPSYVEKTKVFFENQIDLISGSAHIWTNDAYGLDKKMRVWSRFTRELLSGGGWRKILADRREVGEIFGLPSHIWSNLDISMLGHWMTNSFQQLLPASSARNHGEEGELSLYVKSSREGVPGERIPWGLRWIGNRLEDPLSRAANEVYTNDDTPVENKLNRATRHVMKAASFTDVFLGVAFGLLWCMYVLRETVRDWYRYRVKGKSVEEYLSEEEQTYIRDRRERGQMDSDEIEPRDSAEKKLGTISYFDSEESHIKVFWPGEITARKELEESPLWHICPAWVYESHNQFLGNPNVVVNFENCIKCETCWRGTEDVHWSRATDHRLVYEVYSPSNEDLARYVKQRQLPSPDIPEPGGERPTWMSRQNKIIEDVVQEEMNPDQREEIGEVVEAIQSGLDRIRHRIEALPEDVSEQPRVLEKSRLDWISGHMASIRETAEDIDVLLKGEDLLPVRRELQEKVTHHLYDVWEEIREVMETMEQRLSDQKIFWVSVTGDKLLQHYMPRFEAGLETLGRVLSSEGVELEDPYTLPESLSDACSTIPGKTPYRERIRGEIDDLFDHQEVKRLERNGELTDEQVDYLGERMGELDPVEQPGSRKERIFLHELGRRDPSLAWLVNHHIWGCRLLARGKGDVSELSPYLSGGRWLAVCSLYESDPLRVREEDGRARIEGTAEFVPLQVADQLLVLDEERMALLSRDDEQVRAAPETPGGFIGAGIHRVFFDGAEGRFLTRPEREKEIHGDISFSEDLSTPLTGYLDMIRGAGSYLLDRAVDHARSRVQFPGQFQDEAGYDTIAKFGAVKEMIADMRTRKFLLETLSWFPGDVLVPEHETVSRAVRAALAASYFGPEQGSFGYNAGQVFGGTAYSEDDFISKFYRDSSAARFLLAHPDRLYEYTGRVLWNESGLFADRREQLQTGSYDAVRMRIEKEPLLEDASGYFEEARSLLFELIEDLHESYGEDPDAVPEPVLLKYGRVCAHYFSVRAALLRTFWSLENTFGVETDARATEQSAMDLLSMAERTLKTIDLEPETTETGQQLQSTGPFEPTPELDPKETYEAFLETDQEHRSGQFLLQPFGSPEHRFLPEHVEQDPRLGPFHSEIRDEVRERYYSENYPEGTFGDGLCYPRYLEELHTFPDEDLRYLQEKGYLRVPISSEDGGMDRYKAEYYLMCNQFMRFADPAAALVIMANTSIGTTPVQIGLKQDLPRARRELAEIVEQPEKLDEIHEELEHIIDRLDSPDIRQLRSQFEDLEQTVKEEVRNSGVLKYLSGAFLQSFYAAAQAGQQKDLDGFESHLKDASEHFQAIEDSIEERLGEYDIREEAHHFHLRMISAGWVSAFALTEPTAGSDSGGVKTKATLKKRDVYTDDRGMDYFLLDENDEDSKRYILDPRDISFDFDENRTFYRWIEDEEPVEVRFDEYDYDHDSPEGKNLYFEHEGEKYYFDDIGRVREGDNGERYYEYFELNGAKMWITNGRMARVFCLYARTEEGVTGFVVNRHAEGLVVGQDEEKMGQRGSPTNELSLKGVRVPRENVIGYRGRGQVNALETLNAGRTGLAFCSDGIMKDIVQRGRRYTENRFSDPGDRVNHLFGRMAEELFATQSLAYDLVGYTDHPGTESIRMESAIGKYSASEGVHDVITLGERLRGPVGQTGRHDVEKKRRDARVINIYEGTNEVQRFLLLKDLAQKIHKKRDDREDASPDQVTNHPDLLEQIQAARNRLFDLLEQGIERFGQQIWQNVSFQPVFFRLSEMAGLLKRMRSVLHRMDRVVDQVPDERDYRSLVISSGTGYLERAMKEFEVLENRYRRRFDVLDENRYPPQIQVGFEALEEDEEVEEVQRERELSLEQDLRIAVPVKSVPLTAPEPRVSKGEFVEPLHQMNPADRAALREALTLKEAAPDRVTVDVFAVRREEDAGVERVLRRALSLGADHAVRVDYPKGPLNPCAAANALGEAIGSRDGSYAFVMLGNRSADTNQGATPPLLAKKLGEDHLRNVKWIDRLQVTENALEWQVTGDWAEDSFSDSGSILLGFNPVERYDSFVVKDFLRSQRADIETFEAGVQGPDIKLSHRIRSRGEEEDEGVKATTPGEAAEELLEITGGSGGGAVSERADYDGDLRDMSSMESVDKRGLFVTNPVQNGELTSETLAKLEAAHDLCDLRNAVLSVLIPVDTKEEEVRGPIGQVIERNPDEIVVAKARRVSSYSWKGRADLLQKVHSAIPGPVSLWMGDEPYRDPFCRAVLDGDTGSSEQSFARWFSVEQLQSENGHIELSTPVYENEVEAVAKIKRNHSHLAVTFRDGVISPGNGTETRQSTASDGSKNVFLCEPDLDYDPSRDPYSALVETGAGDITSLEDANVIIDVGYGVGDAEGMERLTEPLKELLEEELGLDGVMIGATRKVTQDLELLPTDRQIGQTGVRVNPDLLFALGVSGAPQHVDWIGEQATIFSFNIDPGAPLMNLNENRPAPLVHPIEGDMFETVPEFIERVGQEQTR